MRKMNDGSKLMEKERDGAGQINDPSDDWRERALIASGSKYLWDKKNGHAARETFLIYLADRISSEMT